MYTYVYNNPVNLVDPTGHFGCPPDRICVDAGSGGGGGGGLLLANVVTNGVDWAGLGFSINDFILSPGFGTATWVLVDAVSLLLPGTQNTTAATRMAKDLGSSEFLKGFRGVKAFTASNYRQNLIKLTGFSGKIGDKVYQAHHVLPQAFESQLNRIFALSGKDISIHDPRYLAWWEQSDHLKNAKAYNKAWEDFMESFDGQPTAEQVLDFARGLMESFGMNVSF